MPWITKFAEADRVRRSLPFCYLCCGELPRKSGSTRQTRIDREHIIPVSARGPSRSDGDWSPILDVHRACHETTKNQDEQVLHLWHTMMTCEPASWPSQLAQVADAFQFETPPGESQPRFVFKRVTELRQAVWNWVRGFHSLLYQEPLDATRARLVHPPVPSYSFVPSAEPGASPSKFETVESTEQLSHKMLRGLGTAIQASKCDGVLAWGGRVRYVCRWSKPDSDEHLCLWAIELDHLADVKRDSSWPEFPWHGCYVLPHLPASATVHFVGDETS